MNHKLCGAIAAALLASAVMTAISIAPAAAHSHKRHELGMAKCGAKCLIWNDKHKPVKITLGGTPGPWPVMLTGPCKKHCGPPKIVPILN